MLGRSFLFAVLALAACKRTPPPPVPEPTPVSLAWYDAGTPADDDGGMVVRFIAVGDTGKGDANQARVGAAMGRHCAVHGCDFVALLGDNFYPSGVSSTDDPQWQTAFVQPYASVDAPFYAALGNHDCGNNGRGDELEKGQFEVDYSKVNPKWRMPATHYRFSVRHADFFVADTNRSMFSLDDQVRDDFETWFSESKGTWRITFGHHPLKSNGRHGNAGEYDGVPLVPIANGAGVKSFLEDRVCGRADVYLCGHEHVMEWLDVTCGRPGSSVQTELITSGAGASVTRFVTPFRVPYRFHALTLGFAYIVLRDRTFTGAYFDADGTLLFARTFTK